MTTKINAYLHLGGHCLEAMTFYKNCLGGELLLQSVEDSPMAGQWPDFAGWMGALTDKFGISWMFYTEKN